MSQTRKGETGGLIVFLPWSQRILSPLLTLSFFKKETMNSKNDEDIGDDAMRTFFVGSLFNDSTDKQY